MAGVTEPILYRHFESKRALYLACLTEAWTGVRTMWDEKIDEEPDPSLWIAAMAQSYLTLEDERLLVANLWIQALTEASDDPEIQRFLRRHMRDVHRYVRDVIRRSQKAGGVLPERDAGAEAWVFISLGLLTTVGRRLGGLIEDDLPTIVAGRYEWMTGSTLAPPRAVAAAGQRS